LTRFGIYIVDTNKSDIQWPTLLRYRECPTVECYLFDEEPSWSPDGSRIAFSADGGIYVATISNTSRLDISSNISNVSVYLDEIHKGTTPIKIFDVPAGNYTILLNKSGYYDRTINITLLPHAVETLQIDLIAVPTPTPENTVSPTQKLTPKPAGFEILFALSTLLSLAYLLHRRRK
jgi:hypothetical protein